MIFHSSAPLHCCSNLESLDKKVVTYMLYLSINISFFGVQLELQNSAVAVHWSHKLKVPGLILDFHWNSKIQRISQNFWYSKILILCYFEPVECLLRDLEGISLGKRLFIQICLADLCKVSWEAPHTKTEEMRYPWYEYLTRNHNEHLVWQKLSPFFS